MSVEGVLAAIDGALADEEWPDAMRWSPAPGSVTDAGAPYTEDRELPLFTAPRGGIRHLYPPAAGPLEVYTARTDTEVLVVLAPDVRVAREAFAAMGEAVGAVFAAIGPAIEHILGALEGVGRAAVAAGIHPDVPPDPAAQPFERAMWHRARLGRYGTGPARQVQHRPRPRRHRL